MNQTPRTKGFTIIELLLVFVIVCILVALVALTVSGVQAKNRNGSRQAEIDTLQSQLESYYAGTDTYPTLANINDSNWRSKSLPKLKADMLADPRWEAQLTCTTGKHATLTTEPLANCYSYQVTGNDGLACDNDKNACAHYTLIATLEGGEKYVKSSLN